MKIKIAGGGISGLTAAINLAKAGIDVEIFEAASNVGSRFSGDLQGIENWSSNKDSLEEVRDYGVDINFDYSEGKDNLSIWTKDKKFKLSPKYAVYYLVQRGNFPATIDTSLLNQAKKYPNIKINFNNPISDFSSIDIVATGPVLQDIKTDGMATGYTFKTDLKDQAILYLDDDLAPDGYCYFLVKKGQAVITTCFMRDFDKLPELRKKTFNYYKKNIDLKITSKIEPFSGIGNFFIINSKNKKRIYIGEAGGFQDFALGFGMKYAIYTGYLSAQSIIHNKNYYDLVKKELHPIMKSSVVTRFVYKFLTNHTYKYFVDAFVEPNPEKKLKTFYVPKWWHKLLYPVAASYFKLHIQDPLLKKN